MSTAMYERLDQALNEMLAESKERSGVKLTLPALAARAGVSRSTVNLAEYADIRKRLKDSKPSRLRAATHEDAVEWRLKFFRLQSEKAQVEEELRATVKEQQETIQKLVQRLQAVAVKEQ